MGFLDEWAVQKAKLEPVAPTLEKPKKKVVKKKVIKSKKK